MTPSNLSGTPKSAPADKAHTLVRGLVASTPLVGGFAAEVFNLLFVPPFQKRLESWMHMVAADLDELRHSGLISLEALSNDERFVTTMIQCTQVAIRHHQQEKLDLLRNAVFNTARKKYAKDNFESTFIQYIDQLTPKHIALLFFLWNEESNLQKIKSYEDLLQEFLISYDTSVNREVFGLLCNDLESHFLARFSSSIKGFDEGLYFETALVSEGEESRPMLKVTELGQSFLDFVRKS
jgi:hypothetical protein